MDKNGFFKTLVPQNSAIMPETQVFAYFYLLKVSEMLLNNPKHHFLSNRVEWMLNNFRTPK
jgi:hypothetical protein